MRRDMSNDELNEVDEEPQPIEDWEIVSLHNTHYPFEDDEFTDEPNWCFLCEMSRLKSDSADHPIGRLINYINDNLHLVAVHTLVATIQEFYNNNLREHLEIRKVWTKQAIYDHLDKHAPTTRMITEDALVSYT